MSALQQAFDYYAAMSPSERAGCRTINVAQRPVVKPWWEPRDQIDADVGLDIVAFTAHALCEHAVVNLAAAQKKAADLERERERLEAAVKSARDAAGSLRAAVTLLAMRAGPEGADVAETVLRSCDNDMRFTGQVMCEIVERRRKEADETFRRAAAL